MSDDWDFYLCHVEDTTASQFVDLGIHDEAPLPGLEEMAYLRLQLREPRDDGLADRGEFERLTEIEDALAAAVADDAKIAYVGRSTANGCRDFFFYCADAQATQSCLSGAMVPFSGYEFETGAHADPQWSAYFEFLYPSPREFQMILNGRVLASLEEYGDQFDIEREVCHWIFFPSSEDRSRFMGAAVERGYQVIEQDDEGEGDRKFTLKVARTHAVDFGTINDVVLELFDLAEECNGEYDGWETPVETGEEDDSPQDGAGDGE